MSIRKRILKTIRYMTAAMFSLICVLGICVLRAEASGDVPAENAGKAGTREIVVTDKSVIPKGVYINEEHVGGMTIGEAKAWLAKKEDEISLSVFTLTYGEQTLEIPFAELGLIFQNTTDVLYDAATTGQTGTLIDRYQELKDLENQRVLCTWSYSFDQMLLEEKTAAFAEVIYVEPVDATIDRQNDEWFREPHIDGIEMDAEATLEAVRTAVNEWNGQSVSVEAVVNVVSPKYTTELLNTITEIIGNAGTAMGGEVETGRGKNVVRGAELMHGTILLPGESFSAHEKLAPFNEENGYDKAGEFRDGAVVDNWGGGVCQLTTTLYNAVLRAELQVDRRYNHSLVIAYESPGFDSTVNDDGSKDLVFTNPYDFPIYIEAKAWSETETLGLVYMAIWGTLTQEIREREVELYYKELEREDAVMNYIIDTKLEPGEKVVDQWEYPRLVIEAYKRVVVNGEVVSDELLYTDYYRRSDGTTRHNPIEESTEEDTTSEDESTEESTEVIPDESTEENTEVIPDESMGGSTEAAPEENTDGSSEATLGESAVESSDFQTVESSAEESSGDAGDNGESVVA